MGEFINLSAQDGHRFQVWWSPPPGNPKAGVVVIQEIFGVNSHIRDVTDRFAREGFLAAAPALFDRVQRGYETGYSPDEVAKGREIKGKVDWDKAMLDIGATRAALAKLGTVGVVGFCMGGSLAWLAACRLEFNAAVGYYGSDIIKYVAERPKCPTILHFGTQDQGIPLTDVEAIKAQHPKVTVNMFEAGHGFSCDQRGSFNKDAHEAAWKLTLAHFKKFL